MSRAVLVQCDACFVIGTAHASGRRIRNVNLPARRQAGVWRHRDCGGRFHGYDIEDS